jgi:hypothetical protein
MKSNGWAAWVHLMLVLVIAVDVTWLILAGIFLVPKFQKLVADGVIDLVYMAEGWSWMPTLLDGVYDVGGRYGVWALVAAIALIGLFEWRVKGQNKTFMRLAGLATLAVGLTVVSCLVGASLALPPLLTGPVTSRMASTFALVHIHDLDDSIRAMEQTLLNKDWEAAKEPANRASHALNNLDKVRPAVRALWSRESLSVDEMRARVKEAVGSMTDIRQAIVSHDADQMGRELEKLRQAYAPLREAAKGVR